MSKKSKAARRAAQAPGAGTGNAAQDASQNASQAGSAQSSAGAGTSGANDTSSASAGASADEPSVADIGKNNPKGKRGPTGPRTGALAGAKPLIRKLMGTAAEDGTYPAFSMDELCKETKKTEVNVRTILSDLRSAKYAGSGGVFMTHSFKEGDVTKYRFGEKPVVQATPKQDAPKADAAQPKSTSKRKAAQKGEQPQPQAAM